MTERDKEAAFQAGFINKLVSDGSYFLNNPKLEAKLKKFADLIRADEREALIRYFDGHWRDEWSEGQIIEAIEARGNT